MKGVLTLTALCAALTFSPAWAEERAATHANPARLDELFERLVRAEDGGWTYLEQEIWKEWSRSGSASADFLLKRGRDAMEAEDFALAAKHFTALIEMAPDFPEGYNMRAAAYFNLGLYGPALEDITQTLVLEPRHYGALNGLAVMMEEMGDKRAAHAAYELGLAIHPNQPDIREALERLAPDAAGKDL